MPNSPAVILMPGQICPRCNAEHDLVRCRAHSKRQGGAQCHARPMVGQEVCKVHGGTTPGALAKAATAATERKLRATLGQLTILPVENPLADLQMLAGEARSWKELLAKHVADLTSMRYSTDGGEAIRGEIQLFERAMDRCAAILGMIAKLNIDERMVKISQQQVDLVVSAMQRSFTDIQLPKDQQQLALAAAARYLRPSPN